MEKKTNDRFGTRKLALFKVALITLCVCVISVGLPIVVNLIFGDISEEVIDGESNSETVVTETDGTVESGLPQSDALEAEPEQESRFAVELPRVDEAGEIISETEPATEPATESATEFATESTTEFATEPATESVTEVSTESIVEPEE